MAQFEKHLYMIVHPINALVASQLDPYQFADHYTIGSTKHYRGKVLFVEIDVSFRHPFFPIDEILKETVPHSDGKPKKTKFVASYRVMEHIDFKLFKSLYLVTANGKALEIKPQNYAGVHKHDKVRVYQEIAPLTNLVASTLEPPLFGKYITRETRTKGAPKIFYTQYQFDVEEFLQKNVNREFKHSPIPETNPARLYDYLEELRNQPDKTTKTISLNNTLTETSFALIKHGFWFAEGDELLFYPMPSEEEMETKHHDWWKYVN